MLCIFVCAISNSEAKMEMIRRYFSDPGGSFFLFGPRGTGKSTWLRGEFGNALYLDLLSPGLYRTLTAKPERLREYLKGDPEKKTIIIDEVQKIPSLLDVIHQVIEEKTGERFILTGSSSRKLKRSGVDLLAGRALIKTMHPFIASELGGYFEMNTALEYGMLPLVYNSDNKEQTLQAYIDLYINEEVRSEGYVRNMENFFRFLEVISFSNGSVINASEIARESSIGRKAVEGYISILEDILLAFRLPVFTKKAKRHLIASPKFYFFDAGVYKAIRPSGPLDKPEEINGIALETLVCQHLSAWCSYSKEKYGLYFWRTKSGNEVDFVIYGNDNIRAIEVKHSRTIRSKDISGLRSFKEDYPMAQCILLYMGEEKIKRGDILFIPCMEFLKNLKPDDIPVK